jgi:poly(3-hydroxybutyrate) depolymerase
MPVGAASNAGEALLRMRHANPFYTRSGLVAAVAAGQKATSQQRKWPRLSIWHGGQDRTIDPANGEALAAQWTELHGFDEVPSADDVSRSGIRRRSWGKSGQPAVEFWTLPKMGHGFPVDAATPGGGRAGFGIVDAGIAGAYHIAAFWGLEV